MRQALVKVSARFKQQLAPKYMLNVCVSIFACCRFNVTAFGPTPQKLLKEIELHPHAAARNAVLNTTLQTPADSTEVIRTLELSNHWTLSESLRDTSDGRYLEKTFMESGTMPVSQLKGVMQILPTDNPDVTRLRWLGRFFNQANLLDAPEGQDNATAIAAVTLFYEQGLSGLKAFLEQR